MQSVSYENKIVVYWDLPDDYVSGDKYCVELDGVKVADTDKCHMHVENLKADGKEISFTLDKLDGYESIVIE